MQISNTEKSPRVSHPLNVLVVDDSVHDYRSISLMVKNQACNDYTFDWAKDSEEALEKLECGGIDVVAVDYDLGLEQGSEVISRLSGQYPDPAYLLVTGNQNPEVYKEGILAGASNFVQKTKECGVLFDRTAQYALERKKFEDSLKVANASKDWLMSLLESDLGVPLFSLNQILSTAIKESDNMPREMLNDLLETAYRTSCELMLATNELSNWGRSVKGAVTPNMDMVDVSNFIDRAVRLLSPVADEKSVYLETKGSSQLKAYCDERMFSTTIRNLISAALHYTNEGQNLNVETNIERRGVTVSIGGSGKSIDSNVIAFLKGAKPEMADLISASEQRAVTCIRVASHMLDTMSSSLEVKNERGSGVVFSFKLPLSLPSTAN